MTLRVSFFFVFCFFATPFPLTLTLFLSFKSTHSLFYDLEKWSSHTTDIFNTPQSYQITFIRITNSKQTNRKRDAFTLLIIRETKYYLIAIKSQFHSILMYNLYNIKFFHHILYSIYTPDVILLHAILFLKTCNHPYIYHIK